MSISKQSTKVSVDKLELPIINITSFDRKQLGPPFEDMITPRFNRSTKTEVEKSFGEEINIDGIKVD
jgi:hypothetical protein